MTEARIQEITREIAAYQEAIENAEGALADAERELAELDHDYLEEE